MEGMIKSSVSWRVLWSISTEHPPLFGVYGRGDSGQWISKEGQGAGVCLPS